MQEGLFRDMEFNLLHDDGSLLLSKGLNNDVISPKETYLLNDWLVSLHCQYQKWNVINPSHDQTQTVPDARQLDLIHEELISLYLMRILKVKETTSVAQWGFIRL